MDEQQIKYLKLAGVVAVSASAGAAAGYFVAKKRLKNSMELRLMNELKAHEEYVRVQKAKAEDLKTRAAMEVAEAKMDAAEASRKLETSEDHQVLERVKAELEDIVETVEDQIEDDHDGYSDPYDIDVEKPLRIITEPYIITKEEFFENENEYSQVTIEYYGGDDALVDENEELIPDHKKTVGTKALDCFGYGSGDPNVVYVRNDRLSIDFEVTYNPGMFSREVLGFIQHDEGRPGIRKFKMYE